MNADLEKRPFGSPAQERDIRVAILHDVPLVAAGIAATLVARKKFVTVPFEKPISHDETRDFWNSVDVAVADLETGIHLMRVSQGRGSVLVVTSDDSEAHVRLALEVGVRGYVLFGCDAAAFINGVFTVSAGGTALAPAIAARIASSLMHEPL